VRPLPKSHNPFSCNTPPHTNCFFSLHFPVSIPFVLEKASHQRPTNHHAAIVFFSFSPHAFLSNAVVAFVLVSIWLFTCAIAYLLYWFRFFLEEVLDCFCKKTILCLSFCIGVCFSCNNWCSGPVLVCVPVSL
jgi:hypothetical protein